MAPSKAALNNIAESLKYDFDKLGIRIQVMNPGFVATPLTAKNNFAMPALMPVDRAAARIAAALKTGGFETTFPRRFTWFLKFLRILPQPLRFWFINRATGWNKRLDQRRQAGIRPDVTDAGQTDHPSVTRERPALDPIADITLAFQPPTFPGSSLQRRLQVC